MIKGARITIVGFGHMGQALAKGFIDNGLQPAHIHAIDPDIHAQQAAKELGIDGSKTLAGLVHPPSVVLLAVKPQMMADILPELQKLACETTFFLSIAAGVKMATLQKHLGQDARIVRAMPNMPAAIGYGMTALCHTGPLAFQQFALAESLMACVGTYAWLEDENLMDAVTAVSGSGPAYVFYLIEAMAKAGEKQGLNKELAQTLAIETCRGAGEMAAYCRENQTPEALRYSVMSKGGTTEAAVKALQGEGRNEGTIEGPNGGDFEALVAHAVAAACARSKELATTA